MTGSPRMPPSGLWETPIIATFIMFFRQENAVFLKTFFAVSFPLVLVQLAFSRLLICINDANVRREDDDNYNVVVVGLVDHFWLYFVIIITLQIAVLSIGPMVVEGATIKAAVEKYAESNYPDWKRSIVFSLKKLPSLIKASIIFNLVFWGTWMLCSIPFLLLDPSDVDAPGVVSLVGCAFALSLSVYVSTRLSLFPSAVTVEEDAAFASLDRSWEMMEGRFWRVFCNFLPLRLFLWALLVPLTLLTIKFHWMWVLQYAVAIATIFALLHAPLSAVLNLLIYFRLSRDGVGPGPGDSQPASASPEAEMSTLEYGSVRKDDVDRSDDQAMVAASLEIV